MQNTKFKRGLTLIEVLTCISIFSFFLIGIYFCLTIYFSVISNNNKTIKHETIIFELYNLFQISPSNFKNDINLYFDGKWIDNYYYIDHCDEIIVFYEETDYEIIVKIIKEERCLEQWTRIKMDSLST